jgi:hypothetical protein
MSYYVNSLGCLGSNGFQLKWSFDTHGNLAHLWGKWARLALAGSSKTALIFSIAMVAHYSFDVKNIDTWVPAFSRHNNSFVATEYYQNKILPL